MREFVEQRTSLSHAEAGFYTIGIKFASKTLSFHGHPTKNMNGRVVYITIVARLRVGCAKVWYIEGNKDEEVFMRYSHPAALVPPAQAEAQYDMALDADEVKQTNDLTGSRVRIVWPQKANVAPTPRTALSGSLEQRPSVFRTRH